MNTFVSHLESALDGTRFEPGQVLGTHQERPLWVRYDLSAVGAAASPQEVAQRPAGLWKYRELLPLPFETEPVSLGEGPTPLVDCPRLARELGLRGRLTVKDESHLPAGSFKSRGMAVAVSMARELGLKRLAVPTAGNAGGALAAYAARAGLEAWVFMPADTPSINQIEAWLAGAKVVLVDGLINDCGRIVREHRERMGWFDMSTLREPYRLEGKKTMGLELAEQLGWQFPQVILYPAGGGTGLIGIWKAYEELRALGWLTNAAPPRLIACQSEGCSPIVRAFDAGERFAETFPKAHTMASGLRVPAAVGDFMMLDAIRVSDGAAVAGREGQIVPWMRRVASAEGLSICPETAVCFDVFERLLAAGSIEQDQHVVVFNTAAAQKYPEVFDLDLPRLAKGQAFDPSIAE
jgi:threonine synthase